MTGCSAGIPGRNDPEISIRPPGFRKNSAATSLPCDLYGSASTPCVAAYSSVRALYAGYSGSLYQVTRASDSHTLNIGVLSAGGGDDSNRGTGSFFEGAMTAGYAPDTTDAAIQANIVATNYAGYSRGGVQIVGKGGLCVDPSGNDTGGNGEQVQLNTCDATSLDQRWVLNPNDSLSTVGACLDIMGNSTVKGTKVQLWTCNSAGGQVWVPQSNGSLLNPQSGLCLDDPGGSVTPGTQLQIYTCNGLPAQQFPIR